MRQGIQVLFQSRIFVLTVLVILFVVSNMPAQELSSGQNAAGGAATSQNAVPRLIQFGGALKDLMGNPLSGVQGITFNIYKDQSGGTSLWTEMQNANLDEQGRYTVMLGAMTADGVPLDLFTSGESRWLGVQSQVQGEMEQPRVLLVSVPYALKAADADTLGGQPLSAFVLANPQGPGNSPNAGTGASEPTDLPQVSLPFRTLPMLHLRPATTITAGGSYTTAYAANLGTDAATYNRGEQIQAWDTDDSGTVSGLSLTTRTTGQSRWDILNVFQSTDLGDLVFRGRNGANSTFEAVRVTSSGNVGIGTASPGYNLHVKGGYIADIRSEGGSYAKFSWKVDSGGVDQKAWQFFPQTFDNSLVLETLNDAENAAVPALQIFRGAGTAITSVTFPNGNVGIGTTAPKTTLEVSGGDVYLSAVATGVILKSPDGSQCARISLNNFGVLVTTALACP